MTNKSMINAEKAREKTPGKPREEKDLGREASPDSPQLSPEINEARTGLRKPREDGKQSHGDRPGSKPGR